MWFFSEFLSSQGPLGGVLSFFCVSSAWAGYDMSAMVLCPPHGANKIPVRARRWRWQDTLETRVLQVATEYLCLGMRDLPIASRVHLQNLYGVSFLGCACLPFLSGWKHDFGLQWITEQRPYLELTILIQALLAVFWTVPTRHTSIGMWICGP